METYNTTCPTCNEQITSTFSQAQANRNLGLHRRKAHGYQSPEYEEAKKYRLTVKRKLLEGGKAVVELERKAKAITPQRREQLRRAREARWQGHTKLSVAETRRQWRAKAKSYRYSPEQREKRKQYQDAYRAKMKAAKAAMEASSNNNSPDAALPCSLPICPRCGAKFYVVKGQV